MKGVDLAALRDSMRLEGEPALVAALEKEVHALIADLTALPDFASEQDRAAAFERAILRANGHADDISTEERESLLNTMYDIASVVGLEAWGPFLEKWRGDW